MNYENVILCYKNYKRKVGDEMSRSRLEQETIIVFNEAEEEAEVYTHKKSWIKKLDQMCKDFPSQVRKKLFDDYSKTYYVSKKLISIRIPRVYSQETKKKLKQLATNLNKKTSKNKK